MPPRKRPAAGKSNGTEPKGKKSVKSSAVSYLDVSTEVGRQAWSKYVKLVERGMVILTPAIDKKGFVLGEVVLRVLDTAVHQTGLFVQAEVAAWENVASKKEMKVLHEKDCLAHLCKSMGSCKSGVDTKKVIHLREWKVLKPDALDEKYITAEQRRALTKKLKSNDGKAVTEVDDDDDDDDEDDDEEEEDKDKRTSTGKGYSSMKKKKKESEDEEEDDDDDDEDEEEKPPQKKTNT